MFCPNCGTESSSKFCPNCGSPIKLPNDTNNTDPNSFSNNYFSNTANSTPYNPNLNYANNVQSPYYQVPTLEKKKASGLAIGAFVTSFFGLIGIIGVVLGIVDLVNAKKEFPAKKHGLAIAAIVIGSLMTIAFLSNMDESSSSSTRSQSSARTSVTQSSTSSNTEEIAESKKTDNVVGINEEFGNKTITGIVTDVDLDYKDYNDLWTTVDDGYKVILITIKVTNISDEENYVSVGDFDCYVDNVSVNPELITGGNYDYNANIASGRSAILGACYVIPRDAESIELEYNPLGELSKRVIIKIK